MDYSPYAEEMSTLESFFNFSVNQSELSETGTEPLNYILSADPPLESNRDESTAFWKITVLALMFSVTVIGNVLVLIALVLRRKKLTRMYYFILHLCVSDLLVAFLHVLPQLCWEISLGFRGNNFLCKMTTMLQLFAPYLSSYVLVVTAFDRYLAICYPLSSSPWTMRHSQRMVWGAWILAALLAIPQLFVFSYVELDLGKWECYASFSKPYGERAYVTYYCIANTLIPLVVLVFTYSAISWTVWTNFRHKKKSPEGDFNGLSSSPSQLGYPPANAKGDSLEVAERSESRLSGGERTPINPRIHSLHGISRAKIKTLKLTVVVIACYIICSMPYTCSMLWIIYTPDVQSTAFYNGIWIALLTLLASLNSCVNPWVYLGFNENLVQTLCEFFCCRNREENINRGFLPAHYSRSSISDVVTGTKVVNLGNGVVGWTAGCKGNNNHQHGASPHKYPGPRRSPSSLPPPLIRQVTRTTSLMDDHGSDRALLTSSTPSVSTTASESTALGVKLNGADDIIDMSEVQAASTPEHRTLRKNSLSAPGKLVCSNQHEELYSKENKCACQEV